MEIPKYWRVWFWTSPGSLIYFDLPKPTFLSPTSLPISHLPTEMAVASLTDSWCCTDNAMKPG